MRDDVDLPRVAADNRMIGRVAAEHLIERGFRRCLWVPFRDDVPNRERRDGFFDTLAPVIDRLWDHNAGVGKLDQ